MEFRKRIVIGGSRHFQDYNIFCRLLDHCLETELNGCNITILSGHCSGVDRMAERYAEEHGIPLAVFPAEWERYGRAAGPLRNRHMVEQCDGIIALWDGNSKGTKDLIATARKLDKPLWILNITT